MARVQSLRPIKREVAAVTKWLQQNQHNLSNVVITYETRSGETEIRYSKMTRCKMFFLAGYFSDIANNLVFGDEE